MQTTDNPENKQRNIYEILKRLGALYIDNIRLTSAEKISILFSSVAIFSVLMVLTVIALIFIAMGLTNLLESYIAPYWSYFIIAGVFIILIAGVVFFKDKLVVDPIARFISRLLVNPPKKDK